MCPPQRQSPAPVLRSARARAVAGGRATAGVVASVRRMEDDIIITTMNDLPGYEVTAVFGEVFGLTVRSRHVGSDIGASLKGLIGGEVKGYTKMLRESREEAIGRLRDAAREAGSNAVIAMRFDCNELMSNMTEVAAYGTAVTVRPTSG